MKLEKSFKFGKDKDADEAEEKLETVVEAVEADEDEDYDEDNEDEDESGSGKVKKTVKQGITFGSALAMVISYTTWKSVGWAIFHGLLSWVYVIYFVLKY